MANSVKAFQIQGNQYEVEANITFDPTPTAGSANAVTSDGIYQAIQGVAIGDSISFGRAAGSPVGYASIAYGSNVVSARDYSIAFGKNIWSLSQESFIAGNQINAFGVNNILVGNQLQASGIDNLCMGTNNFVGSGLTSSGESVNENNIYVGYINLIGTTADNLIYSDPEHTRPISVSVRLNQDCYLLDLTYNVAGRNVGDVYKAHRSYRGYTISSKLANEYVELGNETATIKFFYKGPCYLRQDNNTAYSDSNFQNQINETDHRVLYFDVLSGDFIQYTKGLGSGYKQAPNWLRVKVFKMAVPKTKVRFKGRYAYINDGIEDPLKKYLVYSSPADADHHFDPSAEITSQLADGEIVASINSTEPNHQQLDRNWYYTYFFDVDHRLAYIINGTGEPNNPMYPKFYYANSSISGGNNINSSGAQGTIIVGSNIDAYGGVRNLAAFGDTNHIKNYSTNDSRANTAALVAGCGNFIYLNSGVTSMSVLGYENNINLTQTPSNQAGDHFHVRGHGNEIGGYINRLIIMDGENNAASNCKEYFTFGGSNIAHNLQNVYSMGNSNIAELRTNDHVIGLVKNEYGIWTGDGVSYDPATGTYTFPTNTRMDAIARPTSSSSGGSFVDYLEPVYQGSYISEDGHTLTYVGNDPTYAANAIILGHGNYYYRDVDVQRRDLSCYNYIIGKGNILYTPSSLGVGAIGYYLTINYTDTTSVDGAMFLGAYNSMTGTTGAQVIVGIGNSESDRSNGFGVYKSGITAAMSAPDSINAASSAATAAGIDANKVLVTYGMLLDYTGGHSGGGRPTVTSVVLSVADWDASGHNTKTVQGITADSIVIIQPTGSAHSFYYDEIYLLSQGTDELVFDCSHVPNVDITIKVVYWP